MEVTLLLLLILANGIFAMSEIAIITSRKARLQKQANAGDVKARQALELAHEPTRFLSTMQIGITSIGVLTGIVGEGALVVPLEKILLQVLPSIGSLAHGIALAIVVIGITLVSIVIGELVPKRIGQLKPESIARIVAGPMLVLSWVSTPLVKILSFTTDAILNLLGANNDEEPVVTNEEIQVLMAQGTTAGVFEESEQFMVKNVLRLDERKLSSLMIPRADVTYIDLDLSIEEAIQTIQESPYSRFPVCHHDLSQIVGFVRAKDLLDQTLTGQCLDIESQISPVLYVPETLTGTELLENFRSSRAQIAIVVDEYGEAQGLITLRDVMEAIIGEVHTDDTPIEHAAIQREDGSWLLDGSLDAQQLQDILNLHQLPKGLSDTYHTLSGMLMLLLEKIPREGESTHWANWQFEIVDMDDKRIDKVLATSITPPGETPPPYRD